MAGTRDKKGAWYQPCAFSDLILFGLKLETEREADISVGRAGLAMGATL